MSIKTFRITKAQTDFINSIMIQNSKSPKNGGECAYLYKIANKLIPSKEPVFKSVSTEFNFLIGLQLPGNDVFDQIADTPSSITVELPENTTTQLENYNYDPLMFVPIKTNSILDHFWSNAGGIMPATLNMLLGDPGIGKSTFTMDILRKIRNTDPTKRVLFISTEMDEIDFYEYKNRMPEIASIDMLFLINFLDYPMKPLLERDLSKGYDLIIIDSLTEMLDMIKDSTGMGNKQTELWTINLLGRIAKGENERKLYTAYVSILQVNKGGSFVGTNKLKHMTTSMLELRFTKDGKERYMVFVKNRRGQVQEKLYFQPNSIGLEYLENRFTSDKEAAEILKKNTMTWEEKNEGWEKTFEKTDKELPIPLMDEPNLNEESSSANAVRDFLSNPEIDLNDDYEDEDGNESLELNED